VNKDHNLLQNHIFRFPEHYDTPLGMCMYKEVFVQSKGEYVARNITVVDVLGMNAERMFLWSIYTGQAPTMRNWERKKLRDAYRFFCYNYGVRPEIHLVYRQNNANDLMQISPPGTYCLHTGIFRYPLIDS
jgi:hypothetical protein